LAVGTGDSDTCENRGEVVRNDSLAIPKCEESYCNTNSESLAVSSRLEEADPGRRLAGLLHVYSGSDLVYFKFDEFIGGASISMIPAKHSFGLVNPALGIQPARRFWNERKCHDNSGSREALN
jgi:hypothetical protein